MIAQNPGPEMPEVYEGWYNRLGPLNNEINAWVDKYADDPQPQAGGLQTQADDPQPQAGGLQTQADEPQPQAGLQVQVQLQAGGPLNATGNVPGAKTQRGQLIAGCYRVVHTTKKRVIRQACKKLIIECQRGNAYAQRIFRLLPEGNGRYSWNMACPLRFARYLFRVYKLVFQRAGVEDMMARDLQLIELAVKEILRGPGHRMQNGTTARAEMDRPWKSLKKDLKDYLDVRAPDKCRKSMTFLHRDTVYSIEQADPQDMDVAEEIVDEAFAQKAAEHYADNAV